ncbi:hypothetical protein ABVT39_024937 [Epinephelus coioides]
MAHACRPLSRAHKHTCSEQRRRTEAAEFEPEETPCVGDASFFTVTNNYPCLDRQRTKEQRRSEYITAGPWGPTPLHYSLIPGCRMPNRPSIKCLSGHTVCSISEDGGDQHTAVQGYSEGAAREAKIWSRVLEDCMRHLNDDSVTVSQRCNVDYIDQSFDHSLILISTPREESSGFKDEPDQPLKDMIRMCRDRYLKQKNLERPELLTRLGQTAKENNGEHVSCDVFEDATPVLPADHQSLKHKEKQTSITDAVKAAASALRIVLLGKNEDKQTKLGNFITGEQSFHYQRLYPTRQSVAAHGEWRGKPLTVVKTPNIFSLCEKNVKREVKNCLTLCHPGPNVLLLLVKPSEFTEKNRQTLKFILSLFGQDVFKHSMVIMTHEERSKMSVTVNELLRDCGGRYYSMSKKTNHTSLMERIEETANKPIRAALNLVLCGRRGAGKTSAAKAILGQTELHSVSSSSECVKHQGEVCGRWVSLVELPALYGKPQEAVMEESFRCTSLCDPEGVHAFILVLPVRPLTDEDKGELETIRNTFSSQVNDFTLILFTVESDPTAPAVVNFLKENRDIQELCQSCGGRYVVLNIRDQQQIPELLDAVEKMRLYKDKPCSYTTETFAYVQIQKISKLQAKLKDLETKSMVSCKYCIF